MAAGVGGTPRAAASTPRKRGLQGTHGGHPRGVETLKMVGIGLSVWGGGCPTPAAAPGVWDDAFGGAVGFESGV